MRKILAALAVVFMAVSAFAQGAAITGTVTDESGGTLPGATVVVMGPGGSRTGYSDSEGRFYVYTVMSARGPALLLAVLVAGCGRQASPPPTATPAPAAPRRLKSTGLVITCAHVVVGPELIRGVLTVRNASQQPDGKYTWMISR